MSMGKPSQTIHSREVLADVDFLDKVRLLVQQALQAEVQLVRALLGLEKGTLQMWV